MENYSPETTSTIHNFEEALKLALEEAKNDSGAYGVVEGLQHIGEKIKLLRDDKDHFAFACQLHHLHSRYISTAKASAHKPQVLASDKFIKNLARKVNHVHQCNRLWPESSWLDMHTPNPSWLTEEEIANVTGLHASEYKSMLRALGYAPIAASSKDALDEAWEALYNPGKPVVASALRASDTQSYAVVSYVQCAGGKRPPATWTREVHEVLDALVSLQIIAEKAVWFDKLASRQYIDSQKWWGAAATMQFLFNPVIVLLPRMSEQKLFRPTVGQTIWGHDEADKIFENFIAHATNCENCCSSIPLRWALQEDRVLPIAALRCWPRVEHALGDGGFGLFTSETTYGALTALLTCAFAMLSLLCRNDRNLHLELCDAKLMPSSYIADDESVLVGWVQMSCADWPSCAGATDINVASLRGMASCMMELYDLFCKLQSPKLLSLQQSLLDRKDEQFMSHHDQFKQVTRHEFRKLPSGLYYPERAQCTAPDAPREDDQDPHLDDIDVPTLARFHSNDTIAAHTDYAVTSVPMFVFAFAQVYWALSNTRRNFTKRDVPINNPQLLVARQQALTTLVHSRAAQAPCYAWDDKLVAAILLSSPKVFKEAFQMWQNQKEGGNVLARLNKSLCDIGILVEGDEDVEWEANTLIVTLAVQLNQTVHRVVPRPALVSHDRPVFVEPLQASTDTNNGLGISRKCFAGYFLGHLPLKAMDALRFRTKGGKQLPQMNDWVYSMLQTASLTDANMIVIRQRWRQPESSAELTMQCWHCQKLDVAGLKKPGRSKPPTAQTTIRPFDCGMDDDPDVEWGLGCFDPLNLVAIINPYYHFSQAPDSVAVLLQRAPADDHGWHAYALAHFAILGSDAVHACTSCYALIVEERADPELSPPGPVHEVLALWTLLPMGYKERGQLFAGIGLIR